MMERYGILLSDIENKRQSFGTPFRRLLYDELGIEDEDILNAVRYHTRPQRNDHPGKSDLSLILFPRNGIILVWTS